MAPIPEINELCKKNEDFKLNEVSMQLDEGFIMGLVCPNGAGLTQSLSCSQIVEVLLIASIYSGIFFSIYFKAGDQKSRRANYIALTVTAGLYAAATISRSRIAGIELKSLQHSLSYLTNLPINLWNILLPPASSAIIAYQLNYQPPSANGGSYEHFQL